MLADTGTQLDSFAGNERARLYTYHTSKRNVWHSGVLAAIVFHKTVKRPVVKRGGLPVAVLPSRFLDEQTRDAAFSRVLRFSRPALPLFLFPPAESKISLGEFSISPPLDYPAERTAVCRLSAFGFQYFQTRLTVLLSRGSLQFSTRRRSERFKFFKLSIKDDNMRPFLASNYRSFETRSVSSIFIAIIKLFFRRYSYRFTHSRLYSLRDTRNILLKH